MRFMIVFFTAFFSLAAHSLNAENQIISNYEQEAKVVAGPPSIQLRDAVIHGNLVTIKYLVGHNLVDLDSLLPDTDFSALGLAVRYNNMEVARLLIGYGVHVDKPIRGLRPLVLAVTLGRLELIKLLLTSGADPNKVSADFQEGCPIEAAIAFSNPNACELLIQAKAKITPQNLKQAVEYNSPKIVKLLMDNGVKDERDSEFGMTSLMRAAQVGNSALFNALLDGNSDPFAIDNSSSTLLMYAAKGRNIDIVSTLIKRGVVLDAQHIPSENTALTIAIISRANDIAELIIKSKANVSLKTSTGVTPFVTCAVMGNSTIAKLLIKNGASVDDIFTFSSATYSPLIVAVTSRNNEIVGLIAERTKLIDFQESPSGNTALIKASQLGNKDAVAILLKNGAAIDIKNAQGKTAIDVAQTKEIGTLIKNWKK